MDDEIKGHTELGLFLTGPGIADLSLTGHCSKGAGPDPLGKVPHPPPQERLSYCTLFTIVSEN